MSDVLSSNQPNTTQNLQDGSFATQPHEESKEYDIIHYT